MIVATPGRPNWRVAAWRGSHPMLTDDHFNAIQRAVERVRDQVDWTGD